MNCIGENIKNIRKSRGLTQTEVAEKLYTTPQNISRVESGEGEPTAEMLIGLSDILDVSVDTLVGKEELSEEELMSKIQAYFKNADDSEVSARVFGVCKNMLYGRYHKFFEKVNEETETYSTLLKRDITSVFSDKGDRPRIFASVATNTVDLNEHSAQNLTEVFKTLSDPLILPLINKISTVQNNNTVIYDKKSFCSEFEVDEKDFEVIVSSLSLLGLVNAKTLVLNDAAVTVYCPSMNPKIVLLLSLADLLYNSRPDGNVH